MQRGGGNGFTPKRLASALSAQIAAEISRGVAQGSISPGTKLNEVDLAITFGVSRTPVREALRILETQGLVIITPRKGAHVVAMSASTITDIFLWRAYIYGLAARLAARRMDEADRDALSAIVAQMEEAVRNSDVAARVRLNVDFYDRLALAARSPQLLKLMRTLGRDHLHLGPSSLGIPGRAQRATERHQKLLSTLCDGDGASAELLVRSLVAEALGSLLEHHFAENGDADGFQSADILADLGVPQ